MKAVDVIGEMIDVAERIAAIVKRMLWRADVPYTMIVSRRVGHRGSTVEVTIVTRGDRRMRKIVVKAGDCSIVGEWRRGEEYVDIDLQCNEPDREALLDFLGVSTGGGHGNNG